jgi:hypothetical protein
MNPVPTQLLPDLPPDDHALLLRYFSLNEDLAKLSKEPGQPDILSLLRWLSRPEIAAYIAAYRTHQTQLHRQAVIDALRSLLSSPTDQVELRRAATTLLRALNPTRPSAPTRDPSPRTHPAEPRHATTHRRSTSSSSSLTHSPPHPSTHSSTSLHPITPSPPPSPNPTLSPLSQALAALGLPTDLAEFDRLDDEADDAEDDAELDAYSDDQDPPLTTNTS